MLIARIDGMSKSKRSKSGKQGKRKQKSNVSRLPSQIAISDIVKRFSLCGRCSFFVAGYKLLAGEEGWETAVQQTDGRCVQLAWQQEMRELIGRSFGSRLDIDYYFYEGTCPECRRSFQYQAADGKELTEPLFQICV